MTMEKKSALEVATHIEAATEVNGHAAPAAPADRNALPVLAEPTQMRRPWRSTARTLFQAFVALAVLFPILVDQTGMTTADFPWLGVPLAVAAAVTRIMALPQVETFLRRFLPFLAAAPKPTPERDEAGSLAFDLSLIVGFLGGLFLGFLLWAR